MTGVRGAYEITTPSSTLNRTDRKERRKIYIHTDERNIILTAQRKSDRDGRETEERRKNKDIIRLEFSSNNHAADTKESSIDNQLF